MDLIDNLLPSGPRQSLTLKEHNMNVILTPCKDVFRTTANIEVCAFCQKSCSFKSLTIFAKSTILDVCRGSKYAAALCPWVTRMDFKKFDLNTL